MTEKVKVRGLAHLCACMFGAFGAMAACKGLYDLILGEPEANRYAPTPWAFVNREQWLRYGGFELAYGLACLGLCVFLLRYARFLPDTITCPREG